MTTHSTNSRKKALSTTMSFLRKPLSKRSSSWSWLRLTTSATLLLTLVLPRLGSAECPNCAIVDSLLKPCNSSLQMNGWPGKLVYQPTELQAPCACNQNYYDQIAMCLSCQTSTTATYKPKELAEYQLVCTSYHQEWTQIVIPPKPSTTTSTSTSTSTASTLPSDSVIASDPTTTHSGLSSGAIAGIIVSAIALVVALSVAGYVYTRRKRDRVKDMENDRQYKYASQHDSYHETALPQYTGMIQPTLPPISKVSNLRVMNPDSDEDDRSTHKHAQPGQPSFEVRRTSSPGWRRGSFDDD